MVILSLVLGLTILLGLLALGLKSILAQVCLLTLFSFSFEKITQSTLGDLKLSKFYKCSYFLSFSKNPRRQLHGRNLTNKFSLDLGELTYLHQDLNEDQK